MAVSSPQDFVRRLSQRLEEDARITRDAQEWERCIREAALEEGRQEGREEMRGVLEPKHQAELEAVNAEKQTIAKKLENVETKLEELKELRERDNEQMEELKAQVKEKDDRVNKLEGQLAQQKNKVETFFQNWMGSGESHQDQVTSNHQEDSEDDQLSEEESEAGPSKKRRLSLSSTSSPPPNLLPELNHSDKGGNSCECGVDYDSHEQLKEHLSFMETGRRFLCQICRDTGRLRSYPTRKGLRNHMLSKHGQPIYGGDKKSCDSCGVAFKTVEKLEHHLTTNPGTGRLVCPAAFGLGPQAKAEEGTPAKQAKTVE